ncbi:hypothetical protein I317_03757 [Kwoniella heveanensis CBS 569]|nr:hypothetical protein I317_03757 [Kwoniella heveanensis CBS 569]
MFAPRLSKPILVLLVGISSLLLLFAPFTSHGQDNRERLKGVLESVASKGSGKMSGGVGSAGAGVDGQWDQEDQIREWEFKRSLQYEGTGSRIQAFLDKARSGKPFTVSVIGGSVSKGRGLTPPPGVPSKRAEQPISAAAANVDITETAPSADSSPPAQMGATTLYSHQNLHYMIFDWLNKTFPNPGNRFVNGAQGGVGAGYFGWCFKEHIPEDSDLILVEQGINDLLEIEVINLYEHLLRGLLELPNKPAVINVETFTALFPSLLSSSAFHQSVLNFYDVPSIAIRDVLLPRLLADPDQQMPRWFRTGDDVTMGDPKVKEYGGVPVDVMHISARGHALAASLVIRYLREQNERSAPPSRFRPLSRLAYTYYRRPPLRILDVPTTSLTGRFNPYAVDLKHVPVCRSENSPALHGKISSSSDDLSQGEYQGLTLAEGSHGWSRWAWKEKRYLIAREPGSIAQFEFVISPPSTPEISQETALIAESDPIESGSELEVELDEETNEELEAELEGSLDSDAPGPSDSGMTGEADGERVATRAGFEPLPLGMRPGGPYNPNAQNYGNARDSRRSRFHPKEKLIRKGKRSTSSYHPSASTNTTLSISERDEGMNKRQVRGAGGSVLIGYQRSAKLGLGSVWCWVDDSRMQGTQVDGWWRLDKRNMGMVKEVATGLEPGKHTLHCELLRETLDPGGGTEFRLFAVMHD